MQYALDNLGSDNFETLMQSLCRKIIGEGVKIYGSGPDGQREATFEGQTNYPSEKEGWSGYFVMQAKYKAPKTKTDDFEWLSKCFKEEMKGFREKKKQGKRIPDNYLFFTNVVLTPVADTGIKDKMDALAKQYEDLIPHIAVLGYDEICRYLDDNREIAVAYTGFILSGDILSRLYNDITKAEKEKQDAFYRYIAQKFKDDDYSRMEQAGQVTESRISIEKIYVDLKIARENGSEKFSFIQKALEQGDKSWRMCEETPHGHLHPVRHQRLYAESLYENKLVVKGSAGQGKSTVCQFLTQIYRACFLQRFTSLPGKSEQFLRQLETDEIELPKCVRVPLKIELRLYSAWVLSRQSKSEPYDLMTYIASEISKKSAYPFDVNTLREYFLQYPFIVFFDGLDEVSANSNRKEVMAEIDTFMHIELMQRNADCLFIATTRPEGYVGEFDANEFVHVKLLQLDESDCMVYLQKLLYAMENDTTKRENDLHILEDALRQEQIAHMMKTPLQATIMALLVRAGGKPPQGKFFLFKEYFDTIIRRERQKGVETVLNENQQLIEKMYVRLGYELQKRSYTADRSDALISVAECKRLIAKQLQEDGYETTDGRFFDLQNDVFSTVLNRINFVSEIQEGRLGFAIRSMQEFLSALYIVQMHKDEELKNVLMSLAQSAYWKNTFLFAVECISKEKPYNLDMIVDTILSELNGATGSFAGSPLSLVWWGSQLARDILADNIFKNLPKYENKLCKYMQEFLQLMPDSEFAVFGTMSDNVKNEMVRLLLQTKETCLTAGHFALAAVLSDDKKCLEPLHPFIAAHAEVVVEWYYRIKNEYTGTNLTPYIRQLLSEGKLLPGEIYDIGQLNVYVSDDSFAVQKTLFKMAVRVAIYGHGLNLWNPEIVKSVLDNLGYDITPLCELAERTTQSWEINGNPRLRVRLRMPTCNSSVKRKRLTERAEIFGLGGLALLLKTICSHKAEDYVAFCKGIMTYKAEIEELTLNILMARNAVVQYIWNALNANISEEEIIAQLNAALTRRLRNLKPVSDLDALFAEWNEEIPLIALPTTMSQSSFNDLYLPLREKYSTEQIAANKRLAGWVLSAYANLYRHRPNDGLRMIPTHIVLADEETKKLRKQLLPEMLAYAHALPADNGRKLALMQYVVLDCPDMYGALEGMEINAENVTSAAREFRAHCETEAGAQDIIKKCMTYILFSKNAVFGKYFVKNLLSATDVSVWKTVAWENLTAVLPMEAGIMYNFCAETPAEPVWNALLNSDESYAFLQSILLRISTRVAMQSQSILSLYGRLLQYYRNERDRMAVEQLENKVASIIEAMPIAV